MKPAPRPFTWQQWFVLAVASLAVVIVLVAKA